MASRYIKIVIANPIGNWAWQSRKFLNWIASSSFELIAMTFIFLIITTFEVANAIDIGVTNVETCIKDQEGHKRLISGQVFYPTEQNGNESLSTTKPRLWQTDVIFKVDAPIKPGKYPLVVFSHGYKGILGAPKAKYPLVIYSHGFTDTKFENSWLTEFLVKHGFIVALLQHKGSIFYDLKDPLKGFYTWRRNLDITFMINYLVEHATWKEAINRDKIAVAGLSLGGTTALWLTGIKGDPNKFKDFLAENTAFDLDTDFSSFGKSYKDYRIKAAIALAPALGECCFTVNSLKQDKTPVLIIAGSEDNVAPLATNALFYARYMPKAQLLAVEGAKHMSFLNTCSKLGYRMLGDGFCKDLIDRDKMHQEVAEEMLEFLNKNLK